MRKLSDEEKAELLAKIEEAKRERTYRIINLAEEEEQKWSLFSSRCPRCGRKRALMGTGRVRNKAYWWNTRMYSKYGEYRCKHCQYSQWRKRDYMG